jgi:hypothetical protein
VRPDGRFNASGSTPEHDGPPLLVERGPFPWGVRPARWAYGSGTLDVTVKLTGIAYSAPFASQ